MNSIINLSPAQLRQAANIQEKIQDLQKELNQILGATVASVPSEAPKKRKRYFSPQALANIRAGVAKRVAAQRKAGWAKPARRRTMSPAARKKMAALMKARWASAKRAGRTGL